MTSPLSPHQFPAHQLRSQFRPEPHELYSNLESADPRPAFHPDDAENLRQHHEFKLREAKRLQWEDEPSGPDNQSLVDHIRTHGFPGTVLLDPKWKTIVDGNHRVEAAHHIDPNYPVPVTYKR